MQEATSTTAPAASQSAGTENVSGTPEASTAAPADSGPEGEEELMFIDVEDGLVSWLVGPAAERVLELERLSGARITISQDEPVDGKRKVSIKGAKVAAERGRVLLEERLRSAPSAEKAAAEAEGAQENGRPACTIAGRSFQTRDDLVKHIRAMQSTLADGTMLGPEDAFFIFHLCSFHPHFAEKMTAPVAGFKYGPHEMFPGSKCFFVVRVDGTEEGISVMKSVDAVVPRGGKKNNDDDSRGTKRQHEEVQGDDDGPPATRPRRELTPGCVVVIHGLPPGMSYHDLRELLDSFGDCRFVEFLRDEADEEGEAVQSSETQAEGKDEAKEDPVKEEEKSEEKTDEKGEEKKEEKGEEKKEEKGEEKTEETTEGKAEEKNKREGNTKRSCKN